MKAVSFFGFAIAFLAVSTSAKIRANYLMPKNGNRSEDYSKPDVKTMFGRMSIDTAAGKQWLMVINQKFESDEKISFWMQLKHAENSGKSRSEFNYDVTGAIDDIRVSPTKYRIHEFTSKVSDDGEYLNMTMVVGIDKVRLQHGLQLSGIWQTSKFESFALTDVLSVFANVTLSCSTTHIHLLRIIEEEKNISLLDVPRDHTDCGSIDVDPSSISVKHGGQRIIIKRTKKNRSPQLAPSKSDLESMIRVLRPQFKSLIEEYVGHILMTVFDEKKYEVFTKHGSKKNVQAQGMKKSSSSREN